MFGLRAKFFFWVSLALLLTLGCATLLMHQKQRQIMQDRLLGKAESISRFIALTSPEPIYGFDITTLDNIARQVSEDPELSFAILLGERGIPLTTVFAEQLQKLDLQTLIAPLRQAGEVRQVWMPERRMVLVARTILDGERQLGWVLLGVDLGPLESTMQQALRNQIIGYSGIILLLGAVLFVIFRAQILAPLDALSAGARRVAEGNLQEPVAIFHQDEIGRLGERFNEMMEEIREDRKRLVQSAQQQKKLSQAVEQSPASIIITDTQGTIEYVNPKFTRVSGYSREEVVGQNPRILKSGHCDQETYQDLWQTIKQGEVWEGEFKNRRKDGSEYWEAATIAPIIADDGHVSHFIAIKEDITARKAIEQQLIEQATLDNLTGLPNRSVALDRLQQLTDLARRNGSAIAVMFIDLDGFKSINDVHGHGMGDLLLIEVAERMRRVFRDEDTIARLGGDEFLVLLPNIHEDNRTRDIERTVNKLLSVFHDRFDLRGNQFSVTPSIGIAVYPEDGLTPDELLQNADTAMYQAKKDGRNGFQVFTRAMTESIRERIHLENCLRDALDKDELYPLFQPIIDLGRGQIVGAEALLRWRSPELGLVGPDRFIAVAEDSGQIRPITEWLVHHCVQQIRSVLHPRQPAFYLSLNISPVHFCDPGLLQLLQQVLAGIDQPNLQLCLEITEGLLMSNTDAVIEQFRRIKATGVKIAMDDFGTGYSSLSYLKRFPLDYLKIDRSFVDGLPGDPDDRIITETIALLSHQLGISLIAEGIESDQQGDFLRSIGVQFGQGYHYGKPLTLEDLAARLGALSPTAA